MVITTAIKKIFGMKARIRAVPGGTGAGKTMGILAFLIHLAQKDEKPTLTSVVSESMPHLKRGAMRQFLEILEEQGYFEPESWNKSDFIYTFETGSKIEFFSADQPAKVRGPRRNRLFINEANNIPFETFEQLEIRTNEFIFLDWNPVSEFWYYTELKGKRNDVEEITLTYKDNEALSSEIVKAIEARKDRSNWWRVFGEGLLGELEDRIYTGWQIIKEIPFGARLERYGIDFGYSVDPTAIVAVYYYNGGYILDEMVYKIGMSNKEIADTLKNLPSALIIADPAEPKSIDEIRRYGINILPAEKGRDSVKYGIELIKNQKISITENSVNLIREYRNYMWKRDKMTGRLVLEPEKINDHLMDAIRYAITSLKSQITKTITISPEDRIFYQKMREKRKRSGEDYKLKMV